MRTIGYILAIVLICIGIVRDFINSIHPAPTHTPENEIMFVVGLVLLLVLLCVKIFQT